jgi:xylulokinase
VQTAADYVLAIDLGTSGPKAAMVSSTGEVVSSATEPVSLNLLPGGGAEQDPNEWWTAITTAGRRCVEKSLIDPQRIVAVACTAQWAGTVAVDRAGEALRPAVIWMDSRGNKAIRRQVRGKVPVLGFGASKLAQLVRLTGGAPSLSGKDPVGHILWIRDTEPEVYEATHKFLEPVDWINQRMTGVFAASFDSIVLHWVTDNRTIADVHYDDGLLQIVGLDRSKLPDLGPPASLIGTLKKEAASELGVPEGIAVSSGTGDLHAAAVGSGAVGDFDPHLYIGTSSWISSHVPYKKTAATTNIASIPSALPGRYVIADEHETAGACMTFMKNLFFCEDEISQPKTTDTTEALRILDEVAASTPTGANGAIFTPWLNGERTPVDDHTIRGGFHNLSLGTTRRDMVRAVYEGVAYNSMWLLEAVEKFCHKPIDSLAFIGGGANSDIWCQIHADVTGRKIRQVDKPVLAGVRGASFLALIALGKLHVEDIPAMVPIKRVFDPDPSTKSVHDARFAEFVELYSKTKEIHKRLNRF